MLLASQERISAWNKAAFAVALLSPSYAYAQQTSSPSMLAIQINSAVNGMALELEQYKQMNVNLQKQVEAAQVRIKELESGGGKGPK